MKPICVKRILTHFGFHFDEVLAIFLLWNFPIFEKLFPGVGAAAVALVNAGRKTLDSRTADEDFVRETGDLYIGCGASEFDEHPKGPMTEEELAARPKECAATLVAKKGGIDKMPQLKSLLDFALEIDLNATDTQRSIASVIKKIHDNRETTPGQVKRWLRNATAGQVDGAADKAARMLELLKRRPDLGKLLQWAEEGIYAKFKESPQTMDFSVDKIAELLTAQHPKRSKVPERWLQIATDALELDQLLFETLTAADYHEFKHVVPFRRLWRGKVQELKMAVIPSDDVRIHRYARSRLGDQVAVTVQIRGTGNVVVMSNKYYGIKIHDLVRALTIEEALLRDASVPTWKEAAQQLQSTVWFFHSPGQNLFNGAKTSPDTPQTAIPFTRIVWLAQTALATETFEPSRSESCLQGICSSTRERPCPWYPYGYSRCQSNRWEAYQDRQAGVASAE